MRGTIGAKLTVSSDTTELAANASLPIPASAGLDDAHVTVDGAAEDTGICAGTAQAPTAPNGQVCIYPFFTENATSPAGFIWGPGDGIKWGFQVSWIGATAGTSSTLFATWAYTAS